MLQKIDDWLIDRVFQPVVDRRASTTTGLVIGAHCAMGVMAFGLIRFILILSSPPITVLSFVGGVCTLIFALIVWMSLCGHQHLIRAEMANPLRTHFTIARKVCLLAAIPSAIGSAFYLSSPRDLLFMLEMLLWTAAFYFSACESR